ncbi:hypothetical protein [Siccibacter colletis]|uniref:Uncharacterized protein n=1 Tax=Siccibacter colletis TaxID=1505757 RepID=A0ABY6JCV3_9ENTR|nr:hypothetical protein [Siccibacter colletis]UYU30288.1 hypothetical protein KFZ77_10265 [Siccibacter colletis]
MASDKEEEVQRLILLGAISTLEESEREEIFSIKHKIIKLCEEASRKEFAMTAIALAAIEEGQK